MNAILFSQSLNDFHKNDDEKDYIIPVDPLDNFDFDMEYEDDDEAVVFDFSPEDE